MWLKTWMDRLFSNNSGENSSEETQPVLPKTSPELQPASLVPGVRGNTVKAQGFSSGVLSAGWMTDVGKVRSHNEDGLFIFMGEQQSSDATPTFGLFVLADGMGGHEAGEAASALASRVVAEHLMAQVYLPLLDGQERAATQPALTEVMEDAVSRANRYVSERLPGSGTTLTSCLILDGRVFIGHVGDSRTYLHAADNAVQQLTHDHSVVSKLVEIGQLTLEEAAVHPQRNMLYRAVGQGTVLDVDVMTHSLKHGDQLLMCSDGLWGALPDKEMWRIVEEAPTVKDACTRLVAAANAAGGNDNITVIVIKIL